MTDLARGVLVAVLGVALAVGPLRAQSITGLEKERKSSPESPAALLARMHRERAASADSPTVTPAAFEAMAEVVIGSLEQPFKDEAAARLTRDQLVALKLAMLRAGANVRKITAAVDQGELSAGEGEAEVVRALSEYSALLRELDPSSRAPAPNGAERK